MLVISAGMEKSGSAYMYNIVNDVLIYSGGQDARDIKEKFSLHEKMKWHNNNIGDLNYKLLLNLIRISRKAGRFVVKTHSGPTMFHNLMLRLGLLKTIYIYRDPRDVLLSARDHGKKIIEVGENHTFASLVEFNAGFNALKNWAKIFEAYQQTKGVLLIRYEDLMTHPIQTMIKICQYLDARISKDDMEKILTKYDKKNPNADMTGLHFNKGIMNRYQTDLTPSEIERFRLEMGSVMEQMGYRF